MTMNELRELYQEVILDHNRAPRNFGPLDGANRQAAGDNPLCGDTIVVQLHIEDGIVTGVGFDGSGCAISTASASLMTEAIKGLSESEINNLFSSFIAFVKGEGASGSDLGKLEVFQGVQEFPMRVKCATLCWHTAKAALIGTGQKVTTE